MSNHQAAYTGTTADFEAIRNLKGKYCRMVDTKQWDALGDLIADNPELIFKGTDGSVLHTFHSAADFVQSCRTIEKAWTAHHVHGPEIEILSPTTATGIWTMEDQIHFPADVASDFKTLHGYGHYHETYEKVAGSWKIKTIRLDRVFLNIEGLQ